MTAITPEQFMTQTEPEEEETFELLLSPGALMLLPPDPLTSIADSLRRLADRGDKQAAEEEWVSELREAYDDLEAKHTELYSLLQDVEAIIKPSTSKLANSVRDAINAWRAPEVPAEPEPVPVANAVEMGAPPPAHDATVEEWRLYANTLGYTEPQVDLMNRSQIRTLLGIDQPEPSNG